MFLSATYRPNTFLPHLNKDSFSESLILPAKRGVAVVHKLAETTFSKLLRRDIHLINVVIFAYGKLKCTYVFVCITTSKVKYPSLLTHHLERGNTYYVEL